MTHDPKTEIVVYISGGLVQHVRNKTKSGISVEVIDYDIVPGDDPDDSESSVCDCRDYPDVDAPHYHAG